VLLGLSFYVRKSVGPRLWRKLHRATVVVWALGLVHALGAGTDAGSEWMHMFVILTGLPIAGLFAVRVLRRRPQRRAAPRTAGSPRVATAEQSP
jgi:sulfoxide reductase heme-binding subunit YedZ